MLYIVNRTRIMFLIGQELCFLLDKIFVSYCGMPYERWQAMPLWNR